MCEIKKPLYDVLVEVASVAGKCKYHRKVGQVYDLALLAPCGMCLDAFHAVYPYALSLLYGAKFRWMKDLDSVIAQCPNPHGSVTMEIRRKKINRKKMEILIKILEVKGRCKKGLKKGEVFKMNLGDFSEICPAGMDALYPYISTLRYGGKIAWAKKDGTCLVQCPDHINAVVYKLKRLPKATK